MTVRAGQTVARVREQRNAVQERARKSALVDHPVGDAVNTGARLESLAPAGGVLIGPETYEQLPDGAIVEERAGLRVKGKERVVDAYVLHGLPC